MAGQTVRTEFRRSRRGGFTLIEMVAAIGLVTFVLTSVAVTISSLHRVNKKLRDEFPTAAAVTSLGLRLRSDAHSAAQAEQATGDHGTSVLRLRLGEQSIEYRAQQSRVFRVVRHGEKDQRTEVFNLGRGSELTWSVKDGPQPQIVLAIQRHMGQIPGVEDDSQRVTISAAVGLDHATP